MTSVRVRVFSIISSAVGAQAGGVRHLTLTLPSWRHRLASRLTLILSRNLTYVASYNA